MPSSLAKVAYFQTGAGRLYHLLRLVLISAPIRQTLINPHMNIAAEMRLLSHLTKAPGTLHCDT